ncbi:MAG: peptidase bleomycin hydrolase [Bacteroidota bacterium]|jgi:bleomycin hydrolase
MTPRLMLLAVASFFTALQAQDTLRNKAGSRYLFTRKADLQATTVRNQCQTSTCWSFSTISFLESELLRQGKGVHNLSEMFVVRHAYFEKAIMYLRMDGDHRLDEGGEAHDVPMIIKKYGIVPEEAYRGLAYKSSASDSTHNHAELRAAIKALVDAYKPFAAAGKLSPAWLQALNGLLDAYLGKLPETFTYGGKTYTARTFADGLGLKMDDYVFLTSFTHQPFYKPFVLEIPDNWSLQSAWNLPLNEFTELAFRSLDMGYSFAWAADVSEKSFSFKDGMAILPVHDSFVKTKGEPVKFQQGLSISGFDQACPELNVDEALRQHYYDYKLTTDDHGMQMTGWYTTPDGKRWFKMRNSWGTGNYLHGYQMVSEAYFKGKTISIMVHQDVLGKKLAEKLNLR